MTKTKTKSTMNDIGCLLLSCGAAFVTKILIGNVDYKSDEYSEDRVNLRSKVQKALDKYFDEKKLPEYYQQKVFNTPKFLDVVGRKVQIANPNAEYMGKDEFYEAVKKAIGTEAVDQISKDYKDRTEDLNTITLDTLTGLNLSIYKELQKRFGDERLDINFNLEAKYKAFILEAKNFIPEKANVAKPNSTLAKNLVKAVIFKEFNDWYDATERSDGGFDSLLKAMQEAATEVVTNATTDVMDHIARTKYFKEFQDIAALTKEFLERGNDFFKEGEEFMLAGQKLMCKGDQVLNEAEEVIGTIDGDGITFTIEAKAQLELTGAVNDHEVAAVEAI